MNAHSLPNFLEHLHFVLDCLISIPLKTVLTYIGHTCACTRVFVVCGAWCVVCGVWCMLVCVFVCLVYVIHGRHVICFHLNEDWIYAFSDFLSLCSAEPQAM